MFFNTFSFRFKGYSETLKTTDKNFAEEYDGFYKQECWTSTEINLFVSFILQYTASCYGPKLNLHHLYRKCLHKIIMPALTLKSGIYSVTNQN